ncbi:MAG: winged helix-turn-helix domain-containing protein [Deltaproteobacteria bacterium]|jgi:restriction endonuclease Mrr|nr:winged helix-turn-helix domain-containing protein [Deltaproteobacteria bacterium]
MNTVKSYRTDIILLPLLKLMCSPHGVTYKAAMVKLVSLKDPVGDAMRAAGEPGSKAICDFLYEALDRLEAADFVRRATRGRFRATRSAYEVLHSDNPEETLLSQAPLATTPSSARLGPDPRGGRRGFKKFPPPTGPAAAFPETDPPDEASGESPDEASAESPDTGDSGDVPAQPPDLSVLPACWPFTNGLGVNRLPKRPQITAAVLAVMGRRGESPEKPLRFDVFDLLLSAGMPTWTRQSFKFKKWVKTETTLATRSMVNAGLLARVRKAVFKITDAGRELYAKAPVEINSDFLRSLEIAAGGYTPPDDDEDDFEIISDDGDSGPGQNDGEPGPGQDDGGIPADGTPGAEEPAGHGRAVLPLEGDGAGSVAGHVPPAASPAPAERWPGWPFALNARPNEQPAQGRLLAALLSVLAELNRTKKLYMIQAIHALLRKAAAASSPDERQPEILGFPIETPVANALKALRDAGLLERPSRGVYRITDAGRTLISSGIDNITPEIMASCRRRKAALDKARLEAAENDPAPEDSAGQDSAEQDAADAPPPAPPVVPWEPAEEAVRLHEFALQAKIENIILAMKIRPLSKLSVIIAQELAPGEHRRILTVAKRQATSADVTLASETKGNRPAALFAPHGLAKDAEDALETCGTRITAMDAEAMALAVLESGLGVRVHRHLTLMAPDEDFFARLES